jgi:WD40 repeat protein
MRKRSSQLDRLLLTFLVMVLIAGCGGKTPTSAAPSPSTSPLSTSGLLTSPLGTSIPPTLPLGTSPLSTPAFTTVHGKVLLFFHPTASPTQARLELSDPDGSNRQALAEIAPDPRSVAVSPNEQYVAFFTSDTAQDGSLVVWDVQNRETVFQTAVSAEVSTSFRDALPVRYLAWSPDSQNLAVVMNRDLYGLDIVQRSLKLLVPHREEQYTLAGKVMGSIGQPTWATSGQVIVYDTWSPPEILSESADAIRDVEYVEIATGMTKLVVEDAHIVQQTGRGEPQLLLQRQDQSLAVLDLATLETLDTTPPPETQGGILCDPQNQRCVSIVSEQGERDLLRLETLPQGTQVDDLHLADLGESASDCQFHSVLWSPEGGTLLTTVGCPGRVSLWSIRVSDLETTRLTDWTDADSVVLLAWFK